MGKGEKWAFDFKGYYFEWFQHAKGLERDVIRVIFFINSEKYHDSRILE